METPHARKPEMLIREGSRFSLFLLVPIVGLIAIIVISVKNIGPTTLNWGGVSLLAPVQSSRYYWYNGDEIRFEVDRRTAVLAAISGTISLQEHQVEISDAPVAVKYIGIKSMASKNGQVVKRGDVIGQIEPSANGKTVLLRLIVSQCGGIPATNH